MEDKNEDDKSEKSEKKEDEEKDEEEKDEKEDSRSVGLLSHQFLDLEIVNCKDLF